MTRIDCDPDDRQLVRRCRAGGTESFEQLVRRYERRVFTLARRRVTSASDAEDVAQETFLRAWRSLDRYDEQYAFRSWLFSITVHVSSEVRRRARRDRGPQADRGAPPSTASELREEAGRLWGLVDLVLGEPARTAMWLRYAEELEIDDIARILGRTRTAVRVMLHRSRARVRKAASPAESERHPALNLVAGETS